MREKMKLAFFEAYERDVIHQICKILRNMFLVFPILLLLSLFGPFNIPMSFFYAVIPIGAVVCFLPTLLYRASVPEKPIQYIAALSTGIIICILATNEHVGINITYILMPLLATMYFDKRFVILVSLLGYTFLVIGLYIRSPAMMAFEAGVFNGTVTEWYISHLLGYTIEYVVAAVFLISIADRAKKLLINLKETTEQSARERAEKERIGAELNVATQIQASMLPCIFPAFPERDEFDIYASMQPAKEVGGDFYDFFLVDDKTLAVVIADVSGKGVPAALFMVIAKTLIQNTALSGKKPEVVFGIVNRMLCDHNDAGMFVTAMLGYLDLPTGRFTFVNAGHNPPLLRSGERFDWLKARAGFVLAGDEDTFYRQHEIILKPGDELLLYTDGVTEAVNRKDELFGDPKLLETVNMYLDRPLKEFTVSIKKEIDTFADGAEQADDITILALQYKGG